MEMRLPVVVRGESLQLLAIEEKDMRRHLAFVRPISRKERTPHIKSCGRPFKTSMTQRKAVKSQTDISRVQDLFFLSTCDDVTQATQRVVWKPFFVWTKEVNEGVQVRFGVLTEYSTGG
jgi:hypothetical protein